MSLYHNGHLKNQFLTLPLLSAFFFFDIIQISFINGISTMLQTQYVLSTPLIGFIASSYLLGALCFSLPMGWLLDRYPPQRVLILSLLIHAVCIAGFAFSLDAPLMIFFRFLMGMAGTCGVLLPIRTVLTSTPTSQHTKRISQIVFVALLGGWCANAPLILLIHVIGVRNCLLVVAALEIVWLSFTLRFSLFSTVKYEETKKIGMTNFSVFNFPCLFACLYGASINLVVLVFGAAWGARFFKIYYHVSNTHASMLTSLIFIGNMLGLLLLTQVSLVQYALTQLMRICALSMGCVLLILVLHLTTSTLCLSLLMLLSGMFASTQVLSYTWIAKLCPPFALARAEGFANACFIGLGAIMQAFTGLLVAHFHSEIVVLWLLIGFSLIAFASTLLSSL